MATWPLALALAKGSRITCAATNHAAALSDARTSRVAALRRRCLLDPRDHDDDESVDTADLDQAGGIDDIPF